MKDKYYIISFYVYFKNNTKKLFTNKNRLTDIENKPMVTKGEGERIKRSLELINTH